MGDWDTVELRVEDAGTARERIVVVHAPPRAWTSAEMAREWFDEHQCACGHRHYRVDPRMRVDHRRRVITFGTEGEGEGVVSYRVDEPPTETPLAFSDLMREDMPTPLNWVAMTRVNSDIEGDLVWLAAR